MKTHHISNRDTGRRLAGLLLGSVVALFLSGCGLAPAGVGVGSGSGSNGGTVVTKAAVTGLVHGGQQAVVGAHVYLFAAGTTGYSSANSSLLTGTGLSDGVGGYVLSDNAGGFTITGKYTCPATPDTPVYLIALGGDPGGVGTNANLGMMSAVGSCDVLKANAASTFVFINEVTTVASVYALAGFAQSSGQPAGIGFSTSASNFAGLTNAFKTIPNLVSTTTGTANLLTSGGNGTVPVEEIYSLADALQSCINSTGGAAGSSTPCGSLFTATTVNSVAPTNTVNAVLNIATNPAQNVSTIAGFVPSAGAAYQPVLPPGSPADWTMAVQYTGGGISTPQAVAVDGLGNVWVPSTNNSVAEIAAGTGAFTSGSTGYTTGSLNGPVSVAVDTSSNVWVANCGVTCSGTAGSSSLTEYVGGSSTSPNNYTTGGLNATYAVAVEKNNNIWAANTLNSTMTLLSNAGVAQAGSPFSSATLQYPIDAATDAAGIVWTISPPQNALVGLNETGVLQSGSYAGAGLSYPTALAIDTDGRIWVTNQGNDSVAVVASTGSPIVNSPFSGGGIHAPNAIAMDGNGAAWVSNANGSISALTAGTQAASGAAGFQATGLTYANGVAVDGSGNVWVTDCGTFCSGSGSDSGAVFEFVGAGAPTAMPLATAANTGKLGAKP